MTDKTKLEHDVIRHPAVDIACSMNLENQIYKETDLDNDIERE